ncbi:hypothetical protein RE6C_03762 [Rhodopirellula europaea 6C]|uniref:Uncharacterized protein n=1 Tax=Rhodopirellula europaea 6C TaxID=1263867 RepID=M2B181_9BACT|nr:hypothetical protein RE6C_03762 [Rhodopirellula europaea 6C]
MGIHVCYGGGTHRHLCQTWREGHGSKAAEDKPVEGQSEDTKRFDFGE